jgi:NAD(P)-dependent dehydrogenase (short-subunit alcohol dehydrogenase family)
MEKRAMERRCAIVTGAARRIGKALALHLAGEGWDIALHYLTSEQEANEVAETVRAAGRDCRLYRADMRDMAAMEPLIENVFRDFAAPRLLVNSASIFKRDRVRTLDPVLWSEHMHINALAPTLLAKAFGARTPEGGCIVNLLDQKVSYPTPDFFSYTVSKTALATITRLLAMEFRGICRVNAVAPGLTLPSGDQTEAEFQRVHARTPLGVGPTMEEICRAVSFFADAPSVTGQVITIDGGRHLLLPTPPFDDLPSE